MAMSSSSRSGCERLGQVDRAVAVAGGADQLRSLGAGQQQLQPLGGQRLVVGNQDAERFGLSHWTPAASSATPCSRRRSSGPNRQLGAIAEARFEPLADVGEPEPGALVGCGRKFVLAAMLQAIADLE